MAKPTHARANLPADTSTETSRYEHGKMHVALLRRFLMANRNKDRNCYGAEMIFVTILI
jgi:hypothetical protein